MENNTNTLPTVESLQDIQEYAIWYAKNEGFESWRALVSKIGPEQANKHYIGMCQDFAVLFAKYHVNKALYSASHYSCKSSILEAYREDNIK